MENDGLNIFNIIYIYGVGKMKTELVPSTENISFIHALILARPKDRFGLKKGINDS